MSSRIAALVYYASPPFFSRIDAIYSSRFRALMDTEAEFAQSLRICKVSGGVVVRTDYTAAAGCGRSGAGELKCLTLFREPTSASFTQLLMNAHPHDRCHRIIYFHTQHFDHSLVRSHIPLLQFSVHFCNTLQSHFSAFAHYLLITYFTPLFTHYLHAAMLLYFCAFTRHHVDCGRN